MKESLALHDREFELMISEQQIDQVVTSIADRINVDYKDTEAPLFVGVLNGSFMFLSDLVKKIDFNCEVTFVKISSYQGLNSTGVVEDLVGLNIPVKGRHVIIVEDIVDTGVSIEHMYNKILKDEPASLEVCTLFFKPGAYKKQIPIKYAAMDIGDEFIVGYGIDYNQFGRNLKDIYVVK